MRKALISELRRLAALDDRIVLLVGDLGFSVIEDFQNERPDRVINLGVSEQAGMSIAAGMSDKMLPIFYSIANFSSFRCLEQIRNDVAHEGNPVLIVSLGAGFTYGTAGYSHFGIEDAGAVAAISGIDVVTPSCVHELRDVIVRHVTEPKPTYLRLGSQESCTKCVPRFFSVSSEKLNSDCLVVGHGEISKDVMEICEEIYPEVPVISCPSFNRFARSELEFIEGFSHVITVEEHMRASGFGTRLRSSIESGAPQRFKSIGIWEDDFRVGGRREYHLSRFDLDKKGLRAQLEMEMAAT